MFNVLKMLIAMVIMLCSWRNPLFSLLPKLAFSRTVYRYNIFRYKENKKMWWSSFFLIIPLETVALQCTFLLRLSNIEAANFFSTLTPNLLDKHLTDDQHQNILHKILLKSIPFWPEPRSDECHFLSLKLSTVRENASFGRSENNGLRHNQNMIPMAMSIFKTLNMAAECGGM